MRMLAPSALASKSKGTGRENRVTRIQVLFTELDQFSRIEESGLDPWRYDSGWDYLWKPPISIAAFWISIITGLPTVFTNTEVQGVVGIDLVATDVATGKIVASFPVHGTHVERARQIGNAMFGASMKTEARSTFSGASRVALNDAAKRLYQELKGKYGKKS